jgi:hypothetical protein
MESLATRSCWQATFPKGSLPDERLRVRAIEIGVASTERPGAAMTEAFDEWRETRTAYNCVIGALMASID